MCTIALIAQDVMMATTEFMQTGRNRAGWTPQREARIGFHPPRMSRVVVTDEERNRRMKMCWAPLADAR